MVNRSKERNAIGFVPNYGRSYSIKDMGLDSFVEQNKVQIHSSLKVVRQVERTPLGTLAYIGKDIEYKS